jgi:hypothetical protein
MFPSKRKAHPSGGLRSLTLANPAQPGKPKGSAAFPRGAFHFLSAHDRKPDKKLLSLNIPAALTGKNPGNVEGFSKSEMHPFPGERGRDDAGRLTLLRRSDRLRHGKAKSLT